MLNKKTVSILLAVLAIHLSLQGACKKAYPQPPVEGPFALTVKEMRVAKKTCNRMWKERSPSAPKVKHSLYMKECFGMHEQKKQLKAMYRASNKVGKIIHTMEKDKKDLKWANKVLWRMFHDGECQSVMQHQLARSQLSEEEASNVYWGCMEKFGHRNPYFRRMKKADIILLQ